MARDDTIKQMAERFAKETAKHEMTVLHDDGLYRHLRFRAPESSFYWYELVTWPGFLAVGGDVDHYVFARVEDMFTFFRRNGNEHGINPSYWSEKLQDGRDRAERYSEDVLRAQLQEEFAVFDKAYPELLAERQVQQSKYDATPYQQRWPYARKGIREPGELWSPQEAREALADTESDGSTPYEEGARELLAQLEAHGVVSGVWEWRLKDWDWSFLWCCHAIVSGIAQYDAVKAAGVVAR